MVKGEEVRTGICDSDMPPFLASITTAKITCASARRKTRIPLACFTIPKIAHAHYDSPLSLSLCYFLKPLLSLSLSLILIYNCRRGGGEAGESEK
jgi:hypothetical protein